MGKLYIRKIFRDQIVPSKSGSSTMIYLYMITVESVTVSLFKP